ncbi:MAG TPA: twin-arginine translocation signal domain-containing protein [Kofleriaceae bacterium]|jgi:hypothetical protein
MKLTRRAFVAMLGAAAAMLGLPKPAPAKPEKPAEPKPTLWIGHF